MSGEVALGRPAQTRRFPGVAFVTFLLLIRGVGPGLPGTVVVCPRQMPHSQCPFGSVRGSRG